MQVTINKTLSVANNGFVESIEPIIYAQYEIKPDNIALIDYSFAIVIEGVEIDITDAVMKQLTRPVNHAKLKRIKFSILDAMDGEEAYEALAQIEFDETEND